MSNSSTLLSLPYIQGGQAQKHVTHNEAVRVIDAIVHLSVVDQVTAPDAGAQDADRYIVGPGAIDDFTDHDGKIAMLENGAWQFFQPVTGWIAYQQATGGLVAFDGNGWVSVSSGGGGGSQTGTDRLGINATADATNRLTVSSDAVLLTHDTNGSQQVKVNKATATDTGSLLFQTGFSGRAEMGTTGSDDFEIKVSPDGSTFHSALLVDSASGAVSLPNTALSADAFGAPDLITRDFVVSRAAGMVTNSTGYLKNNYNYPPAFVFDPAETPNMPGAFSKAGHYSGPEEMEEFVALDPNRLYRLGVYLRQESVSGDWSAFTNADRHIQYMGFRCYDIDGLAINAAHHARFHHAGIDSLTTLAQPLSPGDTVVHLADATGWNEADNSAYERGLVIFGYKNALGRGYEYYSRIEEIDLFDLVGVDKTANTVTLNQPLPAALGNPDDPGGVWPVGTRLANRSSGWNYKFGFYEGLILPETDTWYCVQNAIGGIDFSGKNVQHNFPPGTAQVRPVWLMNYSNRDGGWASYPDTGSSQKTWVTGVSVDADGSGTVLRDSDGSCSLHVVEGDPIGGSVNFVTAGMTVVETV